MLLLAANDLPLKEVTLSKYYPFRLACLPVCFRMILLPSVCIFSQGKTV